MDTLEFNSVIGSASIEEIDSLVKSEYVDKMEIVNYGYYVVCFKAAERGLTEKFIHFWNVMESQWNKEGKDFSTRIAVFNLKKPAAESSSKDILSFLDTKA